MKKEQNDIKMKKLVKNTDLGIPYTTPFNKAIVEFAKSLLGINKLNKLYNAAGDAEGIDFASAVLKQLGTKAVMSQESLGNIPENGSFILIANHPHGALDGLILIDTILKKRPDAKFLGNFLLSRIEPLRQFFIEVNPFDTKAAKNVSGIRQAIDHIRNDAPLIIFPAGEVSTFQKGFFKLQDKEWSLSMMKFIKNLEVPVIPAFIFGTNSIKFHIAGQIHPILRTLRLPLELLNKRNLSVEIEIGMPVSKRLAEAIPSVKEYSDYLRSNVYLLKIRDLSNRENQNIPIADSDVPAVGQLLSYSKELLAEIEVLRADSLLFSNNQFEIFRAPASRIPLLLHEIGIMREMTFREVGEGTNNEIDIDIFDKSYDHLFLWDSQNQKLVGAYRLGYGDQLLKEKGFEGFYTYSLFEFSPKFKDMLKESIELGRSFIVKEYQKKPQPLMLLWKGIFLTLMQKPQYRYLIGPVSISGDYSVAAKWLIVEYIKRHNWDQKLVSYVVPRNGISTVSKAGLSKDLLNGVNSPELLDKLIADIDPRYSAIPVLLKRYLQLNGKVLGFNIDRQFNDSLDALLLVDVRNCPKEVLGMLSKELDSNQVYTRFAIKQGN